MGTRLLRVFNTGPPNPGIWGQMRKIMVNK
jgi:hypothetical protein